MTVGELVRLNRGGPIDADVLSDIVRELNATAELPEQLKHSGPS